MGLQYQEREGKRDSSGLFWPTLNQPQATGHLFVLSTNLFRVDFLLRLTVAVSCSFSAPETRLLLLCQAVFLLTSSTPVQPFNLMRISRTTSCPLSPLSISFLHVISIGYSPPTAFPFNAIIATLFPFLGSSCDLTRVTCFR